MIKNKPNIFKMKESINNSNSYGFRNYFNNFIVLIFGFVILSLSSCINLREPYPIIEYYTFKQYQPKPYSYDKKNKLVMLRRVIVSESFNTPHILVSSNQTNVNRLYYHRWISDLSTLTTDFLISRINNSGILNFGILSTGTISVPEYYIEPHLIEMTAYNSEKDDITESYVVLEFKFDILKRKSDNNIEIIASRTYKEKVIRSKKDIKSISEDYSIALSTLTDNFINDLTKILE